MRFFSLWKDVKCFLFFFKIKDFFFSSTLYYLYSLVPSACKAAIFPLCYEKHTYWLHTDDHKKYRRNMILQAWNCSWIHSMNQFHCWTYKKSTQENHTVKPDQIFRSQVLRLQTNTHYFCYLQTCIPNL